MQTKQCALEAADGALRCQLSYTEDKAEACEELLGQVNFRVEGIEIALQDNMQVSTSTGNSVLLIFSSYVHSDYVCFAMVYYPSKNAIWMSFEARLNQFVNLVLVPLLL